MLIKANWCVVSTPCQNGGTCVYDGAGGYTCTCVTGYVGTNCTESITKHFINFKREINLIDNFETGMSLFETIRN